MSGTDPSQLLQALTKDGGTIYVDIDCGYLRDTTGAPVSGSPLRLLGLPAPFPPGGIFRAFIRLKPN